MGAIAFPAKASRPWGAPTFCCGVIGRGGPYRECFRRPKRRDFGRNPPAEASLEKPPPTRRFAPPSPASQERVLQDVPACKKSHPTAQSLADRVANVHVGLPAHSPGASGSRPPAPPSVATRWRSFPQGLAAPFAAAAAGLAAATAPKLMRSRFFSTVFRPMPLTIASCSALRNAPLLLR